MVKSDIPPKVKIKFTYHWKDSAAPANFEASSRIIAEDVVVNWGRDSLYSAPRTRTASFTIATQAPDYKPGDWLYQRAEIIVDGVTVFHGTVDHVKFEHKPIAHDGHVLLMHMDAVEGTLFNKLLMKEKDVWISDPISPISQWQNELLAAGVRVDTTAIRETTAKFAKFYEPDKLTMKDTLEMAFKSASLIGQPQWKPNHSHIGSTITRRWVNAPTTIYIPASNVKVSDAEATMEKTPRAWSTSTGGGFGNKTPWIWWDKLGGNFGSPQFELNSPIQWDHNNRGSKDALWDSLLLADHVRADPQRVSIYDPSDKRLATKYHLNTWELPDHGVKFTGQLNGPRFINPQTGKYDPLRGHELYTDDWWYPIGGQLRISQTRVVHHWSAIRLNPRGRTGE